MKQILTLLLLLALSGCAQKQTDKPTEWAIRGYVRSMNCVEGTCAVIFEHDIGGLQTLYFAGKPPVWQGLHCHILFHNRQEPDYPFDRRAQADSVNRLD
jgi:hypothetical protein